jgi:S1-C subfamily serine protease
MDIERLNKSQIVLLTLLVSFVTSIATGIVTVSLMEQAPPMVAQTVNRVIERTVETVVPSKEGSGQSASTIVTQEKTIVVKEADLVAQAVEKITPSIVRIYTVSEENPTFVSMGFVLDSKGLIVADGSTMSASDYVVALSDGSRLPVGIDTKDADTGLAFLKPATTTEPAIGWKPAPIASDRVVLGSSVVALIGKTAARIALGVVTAMPEETIMDTTIPSESILFGSPLMNADGNIVGISTSASRDVAESGFVSATILLPKPEPKKK